MIEKNRRFQKASAPRIPRRVLALIAGLVLLVMVSSATGQVFLDTLLFSAGLDPIAIVSADFNRDGKADVAVTNYEQATISIFLGNGHGTLQRRIDYSTGPFPVHLIAADLNFDGIPDLAVNVFGPTCAGAVLSVFLGNGDGTFRPRVDYPTGCDDDWVAAGDFNADGKTDLVTADALDKTLSVFLGNGDGTLQPRLVVTAVSSPSAVEVADFNGDGKADIATANQSGAILSVFLGNGDGTFQRPVQHGRPSTAYSLAIADFNGDGGADLVVGGAGQVSIFLGNGDGTFHNQRDFPAPGGAVFVMVGDFNGDHHLDIVGTGPETTMLLGAGNGNFQIGGIYGGAPVGGGAVSDMNGDGKYDIVVAGGVFLAPLNKGAVGIMLGNGDGTLRSCQDFSISGMSAAIADFNRDGNQDLATANSLILGNGDGTFQAVITYRALADDYSQVIAGDFNRDGKPDLAVLISVSGGPFMISIYLGNGDGTFQAPADYPTGLLPASLIAADFNGDGRLDLANTNSFDNNVALFLGNGDGTFQAAVAYPTLGFPGALSTGDFNRDGKLDIVTANGCDSSGSCNSGSVSVLLGDGHGGFRRRVDQDLTFVPAALVVNDLNSDRVADLAITTTMDGIHGAVAILLGNGNATFKSATEYPTGGVGFSLVAQDFNGDLRPDLVIQEKDQFYAALLLGKGDGSFRPYKIYPDAGGETIAMADFNNDGKRDVVTVGNLAASFASILLNTSNVRYGQ
jgi:hypothetical protein